MRHDASARGRRRSKASLTAGFLAAQDAGDQERMQRFAALMSARARTPREQEVAEAMAGATELLLAAGVALAAAELELVTPFDDTNADGMPLLPSLRPKRYRPC